ncbi:MAG: NUDIX hydrolase [Lachnospiraceae bacterium]|nr:NUDIX hydrolase [Lachnospiraceae bacterium]
MNISKEIAGSEDEKNLAWEEIRTEHIVQDEWIDFRRSSYRFPDGSVFEPFYSYSRRDYVVIVASDEEGKYLCVRQFRQGIREVTTEFPAGGIERKDGKEYRTAQEAVHASGQDIIEALNTSVAEGKQTDTGNTSNMEAEDALKAARRELLEETGYVSDHWTQLLTVPSNATLADNYAYIFMAEKCRRAAEQSLDETEFLHVRRYSADEIEKMIEQGEFQQAVHIMAWLLARRREAGGPKNA